MTYLQGPKKPSVKYIKTATGSSSESCYISVQ